MPTTHITLPVSDADWEPTGDDVEGGEPWHRLSGPTLNVAGGSLHFEAWAVEEVPDDAGYRAVNPAWADAVEALYRIYDYALETVEINGHEYLLCAFPYGV